MTTDLLAGVKGGLIVSCQAPADDPVSGPATMALIARSVARAGAVAIRAEGVEDIRAIRAEVALPLIGLAKNGHPDDVYITPTTEAAMGVIDAGADVVALDGTQRPRPNGDVLEDLVAAVHARGCLVMADVDSVVSGLAAAAAGADLISTTLAGYTPATRPRGGAIEPDIGLIGRLVDELSVPVVAEGRISTPEQARRALDEGAFAVVVGTAITRPYVIAGRFVAALSDE